MSQFKHILYVVTVLATITLGSCTETLDEFDPGGGKSKLVVDGLVTDSLMQHEVRLTRSTTFINPGTIPVENDAVVTITDNTGFSDVLTNIGNGTYLTSEWRGVPGRTYTLRVKIGSEEWIASDKLPAFVDFVIDSLNYGLSMEDDELVIVDYNDNVQKLLQYGQLGFREVYLQQGDTTRSIYFFAKQNTAEVNYFYFRFFRNDVEFKEQGSSFVFDDAQVQENLEGIEIAGYFLPGDTGATQMLGLSPQAFAYFSGLQNAIGNDGGLFSPPPGNPPTNVSNDGLGFFITAIQDYKRITVGY